MKKILFICHGNICRSPMAEFVMKDMAAKAGAGERFVIDSAATSTEELGNPVYPPARRELAAHGVVCGPHTARQMTRADYDKYDLLIGMDSANIRNMTRICGGDPAGKIHRLLDYTARPGDVAENYADCSKARDLMGWEAQYGIDDMCRDAWNWQSHNPNGYEG